MTICSRPARQQPGIGLTQSSMDWPSATVSFFVGWSAWPLLFPHGPTWPLGGWADGTTVRDPRGYTHGIASSYLKAAIFSPQR